VIQHCAFVSLPDGSSVYLEERIADQDVTLAGATSGNIVINDDPRWVFQPKPRRFQGQPGELMPSPSTPYRTNWLNVDSRLGYVVLGNALLRLTRVPGTPGIWRRTGTLYDTCRMEFVQLPHDDRRNAAPVHFNAGQRISTFALIALPNSRTAETKSLADEIRQAGWAADEAGCLAVRTRTCLVYANFSPTGRRIVAIGGKAIPPQTCGWSPVDASGRPRQ